MDMEDIEDGQYMKSTSSMLKIDDVEEALMGLKKFYRKNFFGTINVNQLKKIVDNMSKDVSEMELLVNTAQISPEQVLDFQNSANQLFMQYSNVMLLHELAIVNGLKSIENLDFLNKKTLRSHAEKIMKYESPESYEYYLNENLDKKYGATYGSFYR